MPIQVDFDMFPDLLKFDMFDLCGLKPVIVVLLLPFDIAWIASPRVVKGAVINDSHSLHAVNASHQAAGFFQHLHAAVNALAMGG